MDYEINNRTRKSGSPVDLNIDHKIAHESSVLFWQQELADAPRLELPVDFPRTAITSYRLSRLAFSLPSAYAGLFKQLNRQLETPLFTTLLAAYGTLLFRYTSQEDIVIGLPASPKMPLEVASLTGTGRNTRICRVDLSGTPRFSDLVRRIRRAVSTGNMYEAIPYGELEGAEKSACGINYPGLYSVIFSYENLEDPVNDDLYFDNDLSADPCNYVELGLSLKETSEGINGLWTYNAALFEADTIRRFAKHFGTLLRSIVLNPQQTIGQLQLLTDAEKSQLTLGWNTSKTDYPPNKCIHELFEEQVRESPGTAALVFGKKQWTYTRLNALANQFAHYLISRGIGTGVLVPVCIDHSPEMIIAILGILKAGSAYVPLDPNSPTERLSYFLEDTKARVVVGNKGSKALFQAFKDVDFIDLTGDISILKNQPKENLNTNFTSDNLAYIIYTSGTTGKPKGVMIEHRSLADHCFGVIESAGLKSCRSFALFSPLAFDAGHSIIHSAFLLGACLHVLPLDLIMNSENVKSYIDANAIDCIKIVPSLWLSYARLNQIIMPRKAIIFGGEAFRLNILNYLRNLDHCATIYNHYGPTEATIGKCIYKVDPAGAYQNVPIGRPFSNTRVYILDDLLQLVPVGIRGELYIAGDGVARGYLGQPGLTAEKFIPDPFLTGACERMYKTGDKVRWLADGNIEYLGRKDEQVKIDGYRIELGEIEDVLLKSGLVSQAVVISDLDKNGSQRLMQCIVPAEQYHRTALHAILRKNLPEYMIPVIWVELDSIPLTANGKIDKKELVNLAGIHKPYIAPQNNAEARLAAVWQELLKRERISIDDNFFELGGNSLLAVVLFKKIKKEFNKDFPLAAIFSAPTISQLAIKLQVTAKGTLSTQTIVPIQRNGTKPPLFCLHAGHGDIIFYGNLSLHLGHDQPFYALQARGISGTEIPYSQMETMADYYVSEMRKVQPEGPYYLAGYCFGARIAFEMAQQLTQKGQRVALLANFNGISPTYGRRASNATNPGEKGAPEKFLEKTSNHLNAISNLNLKDKVLYTLKKLNGKVRTSLKAPIFLLVFKLNGLLLRSYLLRKRRAPQVFVWNYVAQSLYLMQCKYKPKAYHGKMLIFRSPGLYEKDPYLGWKDFVKGEIKTFDVPGTHETRRDILNEPFVQSLAKQLKSFLPR